MKKDYKNFNYLKEKLSLLMSKYCIYSFRLKNQNLTNNNKKDLKQYRLYLNYVNKILEVMDTDNAETYPWAELLLIVLLIISLALATSNLTLPV
ncbi:MAG: hypothetical protein II392_00670, partial [Mycoplasma sp.]|nr:hypothetical protein [Mycoplasma sp.]